MYVTSRRAGASHTDDGREVWWLAHANAGLSPHGVLGVVRLDPHATCALHRHPVAEEAVFVIKGSGTALIGAAERELGPESLMFAPPDAWHGFRAGDGGALLLLAYGGIGLPEDRRSDLAPPSTSLTGPRLCFRDPGDVSLDELHNPEMGFIHMRSGFYIDGEIAHSHQLAIGLSVYADDDAIHALHVHARAPEFLLILEGQGVNLGPDGATDTLAPGEVGLTPAGEVHGFRRGGASPTRIIFGFLGANSPGDAGYVPAPHTS